MDTPGALQYIDDADARCEYMLSAGGPSRAGRAERERCRACLTRLREEARAADVSVDYAIEVSYSAEELAMSYCAQRIDATGWLPRRELPAAWCRITQCIPRKQPAPTWVDAYCYIDDTREAAALSIADILVECDRRRHDDTAPPLSAAAAQLSNTLAAALRDGRATADAFVALANALLADN